MLLVTSQAVELFINTEGGRVLEGGREAERE